VKPTIVCDLRRVRTDRGLSQAELAARAGVGRQAINSIETGKYTPATEVSLRLAAALDCRIEDIFRLDEAPPETEIYPAEPITPGERLVLGRVGERVVAHRIAGPRFAPDAFAAATGHATAAGASLLIPAEQLESTVLLAGCDPSLSILAEFMPRRSREHRVVPLHSPSEAALRELADGAVHVAGSHLPGGSGAGRNVSQARRALADGGGRVVTYASWEQGIVVGKGNPRQIQGIADLARADVRIVNRDPGSGSRRLLDEGLAGAGVTPAEVRGYETVVPTHMAVARSVEAGVADAGVALRAVAHALDLDFVPLTELRFDLVIPAEHLDHPTVRLMLEVLASRVFRSELAALPGYDVSRTGSTLIELKAA
jgi:molybdate-binding protein/DNA-binding XRE family transcriptional regulator